MKQYNPLTNCSDEEILSRLKKGQRDVFGTLVRRYQQELFGYLRRYLGDAELAEDVFQATFLQVFTKISQYETGRSARPWLYAIATNLAIDALRRQGRHPTLSLEQQVESDGNGQPRSLSEMLQAREVDPLEHSETEERRAMIRASVDRLPDFLRQVVILAYYQGLKYREVADIVGIPVGTVKSRLHTALTKLHEIWSETPSYPEL